MSRIIIRFQSPYNRILSCEEIELEVEEKGIYKKELRGILLRIFPSLASWCGSGKGGSSRDYLILVVNSKFTPEDEKILCGSIV